MAGVPSGVVHSIIVALGCTPALGFVHTGHQQSFVYDIADLYKADLTIPLAFDIAAENCDDVGAEARRLGKGSSAFVADQAAGLFLEHAVTAVATRPSTPIAAGSTSNHSRASARS